MPAFEFSNIGSISSSSLPEILSRQVRVLKFGVDCSGPANSDGIEYRHGEWSPGGEYIKQLSVKNVGLKTIKLRYKLPATRYFFMMYPETIVLSPGMVKDIEVAFRPVQYENYSDTIYFKVVEENPNLKPIGFHVPVRAFISTLAIKAPDALDFGFCTVNEESSRTFELVNIGQVPAPFRWEVPGVFTIEPQSAIIPVHGSMTMRIRLVPSEASVFVSSTLCHVGEGVNAIKPEPILTTKFSAIGKYPHLSVSEDTIDFGEVQVGTKGEAVVKVFILRNHSVVPVNYKLVREESDCDSVFHITPTEGVLLHQAETRVTVTYKPQAFGTFSCENFTFTTPGGNAPRVQVIGTAVGAGIVVAKSEDPALKGKAIPNSISFGDIRLGEGTTRVLYLYNRSPLPIHYNFMVGGDDTSVEGRQGGDQGSVFSFNKPQGVIPAGLETHVIIRFAPNAAANYYRRVFCLLENQHPAYIDIFGTGYIPAKGEIKEQRPAPIRHAHIQAFRNRVAAGLGHLCNEELDQMLAEDGINDFFAKNGIGYEGTKPMAFSRIPNPVTRSGEATRNEVAVSAEYFLEVNDESNQIVIDRPLLEYGYLGKGQSETRTVKMTNRTNGKVTAVWTPVSDGSFQVYPASVDIGPHKSCVFKVVFEPRQDGAYYSRGLEVLVYFKNQRSFRLVDDTIMSPPWMLHVAAHGHSFPGEQFLAKVSIGVPGRRLTLSACHMGDAVYQTIRLTNQSKLPACFEVKLDNSSAFRIKPSIGMVPAESLQLIEVCFRPQGDGMHHCLADFVFNNCEETSESVLLMGLGQEPKIKVLDVGEDGLFLRPTAVGLISTTTFKLQNQARIPLHYHLALPDHARENFSISPVGGRLKGKETQVIKLSFAPGREETYNIKLPILVKALAGSAPNFRDAGQIGEAAPADLVQTEVLSVLALTSEPAIAFEPADIDFGVRLVNDKLENPITLVNNSDSDVSYVLNYVAYPSASAGPEARIHSFPLTSSGTDHPLLFDMPSGILPARSKTLAKVTFQPDAAGDYSFAIIADLRSVNRDGNPVTMTPVESALLRFSQDVRKSSSAMLDDPSPRIHNEDDAGHDEELPADTDAEEAHEESLMCRLTGKATFPCVVIRDVRAQGGGVGVSAQQLWKQFSLSEMNRNLLEPLIKEEIAFNRQSTPDMSKLPKYSLMFSPNVIGEASQMLFFDLCNTSDLPTSFSIHLPDEREIELEHWADEGEPTEEEILHRAIIDEIKCFDIYPKIGSLQPGETLTLNIAYHYTSMRFKGMHRLPVLLRIAQGKQFCLVLQGRTVDIFEPFVFPLTGPKEEFELFPVPVGTPHLDGPVQYTELRNPADAIVDYEINTGVLDKLKRKNHDYPILALENPKGTIPARSRTLLKWRFTPLEGKTYTARIHVQYTGGNEVFQRTAKFTIKAKGYDVRVEDHHRKPISKIETGLEAPRYQLIEAPDTLAILSEDRLLLGRVVARATMTKLVVLRNITSNKHVEFVWDLTHDLIRDGLVSFAPSTGTIGPADTALIKVKINAQCNPVIVNNCFSVVLKEVADPKLKVKSKSAMDLIKNRLTDRSSNSARLGISHEPLVSRPTMTKSAFLETIEIKSPDRKAHLPSSKTRLPPPGPEGSPIRRVCPKGSNGSKSLSRKSSARSLKSQGNTLSQPNETTNHGNESTAEPMTNTLEVYIQAEVVRETASYLHELEDTKRAVVLEPLSFIKPDLVPTGHHHAANHGGGLPGSAAAVTAFSPGGGDLGITRAAAGYMSEDYLDEEGGFLLKEVFSELFHDVLLSSEVTTTFQELREQERGVFFAEIKANKPLYEMLAQEWDLPRTAHYMMKAETIFAKIKEVKAAIDFKLLEGVVTQLVEEQKAKTAAAIAAGQSTASTIKDQTLSPRNQITSSLSPRNQSTLPPREQAATPRPQPPLPDMIDLRRVVSRMPVQMRNSLDTVLTRRRAELRRTARKTSKRSGGASSRHNDPYDAFVMLKSQNQEMDTSQDLGDSINLTIRDVNPEEEQRIKDEETKLLEAQIALIVEKEALLYPDCQRLIIATLEETLNNLAQEILLGEFNPLALPKQYVCAINSPDNNQLHQMY